MWFFETKVSSIFDQKGGTHLMPQKQTKLSIIRYLWIKEEVEQSEYKVRNNEEYSWLP